MDLSHINRNDPCPCGSGKKFKRCHMGRESELLQDTINPDPAKVAKSIMGLPLCDHPRAQQMAGEIKLTSAAGREMALKLVDLAAYLALNTEARRAGPDDIGGLFISPSKTRVLDPASLYMALSPKADDSTVVHQLAHAVDYIKGSRMQPGLGREMAGEAGVPLELLEHPQEYGDALLDLAERFGVELDAEDEIIAFLARRKLLMSGKLITTGNKQELTSAAEKTMRFMQDNKDEINNRIKDRQGYAGGGPKEA